MPLPYPHVGTKIFAIKDMEIYKVTADIVGSATTYGTKVKLPGAQSIAVTETWKESFLRGDNTLLDYESVRDTVRIVVKHGKLALDAISIITGSTTADTGTTPNQVVTNVYDTADVPGFFKIEAQCWSTDGVSGDYHILAGKVKIAGSRSFGLAEEGFELFQFDVVAIKPLGTGSFWYREAANETAVAIA